MASIPLPRMFTDDYGRTRNIDRILFSIEHEVDRPLDRVEVEAIVDMFGDLSPIAGPSREYDMIRTVIEHLKDKDRVAEELTERMGENMSGAIDYMIGDAMDLDIDTVEMVHRKHRERLENLPMADIDRLKEMEASGRFSEQELRDVYRQLLRGSRQLMHVVPKAEKRGPGTYSLGNLIKGRRKDPSKADHFKKAKLISDKDAKHIGDIYYDKNNDKIAVVVADSNDVNLSSFSGFSGSSSIFIPTPMVRGTGSVGPGR